MYYFSSQSFYIWDYTDKIFLQKVIYPSKPTMAVKHVGAEQAARGGGLV